jgi:hypothetical protein
MLPMNWCKQYAAILALAGCCAVGGCRNQSTTMPNPFAQADRVPAPPTRVPAPGQAVPNYGSWPATTPAMPVSAPSPGVPASPAGFGSNLSPANTQLASGGPVGVPTDNQSLRFELPPPQLEQPIVEVAARNLPPGTNLGGPATFVPPSSASPTTSSPRVRMPDGNSFAREPLSAATNQANGQLRQRPAIVELPPRPAATTPVVDQTSDGFRARGTAHNVIRPNEPTLPAAYAGQTPSQQYGYGYGPTYQQLRGRLEFSPALGHWKLRYIPIDGATDEFGGSATIANPDALYGYQAGDWIVVDGNLHAQQTVTGGYVALFTINSIARQ